MLFRPNALRRIVSDRLRVPCLLALTLLPLAVPAGCPQNVADESIRFPNLGDQSNAAARFVGSSACRNCHADVAALHELHGHAHPLTPTSGGPPAFPSASAARAAVPDPPPGFSWADVAYVIGGYTHAALFVDQSGYILTSGTAGVDTQWNLAFPPGGRSPAFAPYDADATAPRPFDYSCFVCHTTGPQPPDPAAPRFQDSRPGLAGTWHEPGVQCEACHGPGSNHFKISGDRVVIQTDRVFVDADGAQTCNTCHSGAFGDTSGRIPARDGFVASQAQYAELLASGGHSTFACTICHDPHRSVAYDRGNAIRNDCGACHSLQNMAGHAGKVLRRADYTETVTCVSCHMPLATLSASAADPAIVGPAARVADVRTHIFRINTNPLDFSFFISSDGSEVRRDPQGRAAVTVDYVCLRCHNGNGAFELSVRSAADIAPNAHRLPD